ncbi:MAG: hypothetical protein J6B94_09340 [Lachnospiraceae bacterium]|nr:hypothetical protein [Lachnospiraceae bacterium]
MDEYVIKVTPQRLETISQEVVGKVENVKKAFENVTALISSTEQYWQRKGNRYMREAYSIRKDDYERIFAEIKGHVIKLQTIAGVYRETENANLDIMDILPGDVII